MWRPCMLALRVSCGICKICVRWPGFLLSFENLGWREVTKVRKEIGHYLCFPHWLLLLREVLYTSLHRANHPIQPIPNPLKPQCYIHPQSFNSNRSSLCYDATQLVQTNFFIATQTTPLVTVTCQDWYCRISASKQIENFESVKLWKLWN